MAHRHPRGRRRTAGACLTQPTRGGRAVPVRTCLGCRQKLLQGSLVRLRVEAGKVVIDHRGFRGPGRGAYLCANMECLEAAIKRRALRRALGLDFAAADQTALARTLAGMISSPPTQSSVASMAGLAEEER
ncbi:MAG: YlxR family protein [Candidatus Dormibacteria bacterium]